MLCKSSSSARYVEFLLQDINISYKRMLYLLEMTNKSFNRICVYCSFNCAAAAIIIFAAVHSQPPQPLPEGFIGIDTNYGRVASGSAGFTKAFIRTSDIAVKVLAETSAYVVVPETVAGIWTQASEKFWSGLVGLLKERGQTLVVGAEIYGPAQKYDNGMLFLGRDGNKLYHQKVPVPVSMWRPFGGAGTANAYWFDSGTVELADGRRPDLL